MPPGLMTFTNKSPLSLKIFIHHDQKAIHHVDKAINSHKIIKSPSFLPLHEKCISQVFVHANLDNQSYTSLT